MKANHPIHCLRAQCAAHILTSQIEFATKPHQPHNSYTYNNKSNHFTKVICLSFSACVVCVSLLRNLCRRNAQHTTLFRPYMTKCALVVCWGYGCGNPQFNGEEELKLTKKPARYNKKKTVVSVPKYIFRLRNTWKTCLALITLRCSTRFACCGDKDNSDAQAEEYLESVDDKVCGGRNNVILNCVSLRVCDKLYSGFLARWRRFKLI